MKFKLIIIALCCLTVGCGGTWFPRQSNFGKKVQSISPQEKRYHRTTSAREKQGCFATTSHLQPQLNRTIYGECVRSSSGTY
ncbi:MAG: hypothetical protein Q4A60_08555 [Pasteurellaceae bacterium]|nr:hypothetical protein [Pasteurellaceae bacterium]